MQVHYDIHALPHFKNAVVTIGTFDGVHLGHSQILAALQAEAKAVGGETVIITFHPHPRQIVYPDKPLQLINTIPEKTALLHAKGVDHLVVVPFDKKFAALSAHDYVSRFLVERFHPHTIIIGYDHHFGQGRSGNFALLEKLAPVYNFRLKQIPQHVLDAVEISSTKIRKAILEGDVAVANKLLGYPFFFSGTVVGGDRLGRTLGYPTANLQYIDGDKIHLGEGVFAVTASVKVGNWKGMLSIGKRPTLNDTMEKVEVNLFDFDQDIYGETVTVYVHHYLRPQERYADLQLLKSQIDKDKEDSIRLLKNIEGKI